MAAVPNDIESAQYVSLSTFRRSGVAVATPVWFAVDGSKLYLYSEKDAGKMKRVRANAKVTLAKCDGRGKVAPGTSVVSGTAIELTGERGAFVHALLNKKYGWKKKTMEFFMAIPEKLRIRTAKPDGFLEITLD